MICSVHYLCASIKYNLTWRQKDYDFVYVISLVVSAGSANRVFERKNKSNKWSDLGFKTKKVIKFWGAEEIARKMEEARQETAKKNKRQRNKTKERRQNKGAGK